MANRDQNPPNLNTTPAGALVNTSTYLYTTLSWGDAELLNFLTKAPLEAYFGESGTIYTSASKLHFLFTMPNLCRNTQP